MSMSGFCRALLYGVMLGVAGPAMASSIYLSGTVVKSDGTGLEGVVIRLSHTGLSTTTNGQGAWSFAPAPVGIRADAAGKSRKAGHLELVDGGLHLRFEGRDVAGRGRGLTLDRSIAKPAAARIMASLPDTVVYSYNQKVFLKDTLSNLDTTGILRVYDTTWNAAIVYGELKDSRDGRKYRVVTIGSQRWMAENVKYSGPNDTTGSCYSNSADSCDKYGRLYRWAEAMGLDDSCNAKSCAAVVSAKPQGICPAGWHVPGDAEWYVLTDTALTYAMAGMEMKSVAGWKTNNGTDAYGFRALPGGLRSYTGSFYLAGVDGNWWTSTENEANNAFNRIINNANKIVNLAFNPRISRLSVRCVKD